MKQSLLTYKGHTIVARHKPSPKCCRCGYAFHTFNERMVDVQYPATKQQAATVTHRCKDNKACRKRAEKE